MERDSLGDDCTALSPLDCIEVAAETINDLRRRALDAIPRSDPFPELEHANWRARDRLAATTQVDVEARRHGPVSDDGCSNVLVDQVLTEATAFEAEPGEAEGDTSPVSEVASGKWVAAHGLVVWWCHEGGKLTNVVVGNQWLETNRRYDMAMSAGYSIEPKIQAIDDAHAAIVTVGVEIEVCMVDEGDVLGFRLESVDLTGEVGTGGQVSVAVPEVAEVSAPTPTTKLGAALGFKRVAFDPRCRARNASIEVYVDCAGRHEVRGFGWTSVEVIRQFPDDRLVGEPSTATAIGDDQVGIVDDEPADE